MSSPLSRSVPWHLGQCVPAGASSLVGLLNQAFGALGLENRGHELHRLGQKEGLVAGLADIGRDGHAPQALARQAPVGPNLDHAADAIAAPGRDPLGVLDFSQRLFAQTARVAPIAQACEPLAGGAE